MPVVWTHTGADGAGPCLRRRGQCDAGGQTDSYAAADGRRLDSTAATSSPTLGGQLRREDGDQTDRLAG